jgi:hypothetical protein
MTSKPRWAPLQPDLPFAKKSDLASCVNTLLTVDSPHSRVHSRSDFPAARSPTSSAQPEPLDSRTDLESRFPILRLWRP